MAQHAILRFEKHKGHPAGPLEAHHERKKDSNLMTTLRKHLLQSLSLWSGTWETVEDYTSVILTEAIEPSSASAGNRNFFRIDIQIFVKADQGNRCCFDILLCNSRFSA